VRKKIDKREREHGGQGRRFLLLSGAVLGPTFQIFGIGYTLQNTCYISQRCQIVLHVRYGDGNAVDALSAILRVVSEVLERKL
jgi:hypothetical protein